MDRLQNNPNLLAASLLALFAGSCAAPEASSSELDRLTPVPTESHVKFDEVLSSRLAEPASASGAREIAQILSEKFSAEEESRFVLQGGKERLVAYASTLPEDAEAERQRIGEIIFAVEATDRLRREPSVVASLPLTAPGARASVENALRDGDARFEAVLTDLFNSLPEAMTEGRVKFFLQSVQLQKFMHRSDCLSLRLSEDASEPDRVLSRYVQMQRFREAHPLVQLLDSNERRWTPDEIGELASTFPRFSGRIFTDRVLILERAREIDSGENAFAAVSPELGDIRVFDANEQQIQSSSGYYPSVAALWLTFNVGHEMGHYLTHEDPRTPFRIPEDLARLLGWRKLTEDFPGFTTDNGFGWCGPERMQELVKDRSLTAARDRAAQYYRLPEVPRIDMLGESGEAVLLRSENGDSGWFATAIRLSGNWYIDGDSLKINGESRALVQDRGYWLTVPTNAFLGSTWRISPAEHWADMVGLTIVDPDLARGFNQEAAKLAEARFRQR